MAVVHKRRGNLETDVQRKEHEKTQGEDDHLQARERHLRRNQPR